MTLDSPALASCSDSATATSLLPTDVGPNSPNTLGAVVAIALSSSLTPATVATRATMTMCRFRANEFY